MVLIAELIGSELTKQNREKGLWRGRAAYLIDGTMITLPRTQSILKDFPRGVAAYNLLRACLAVAAKKLGLEPHQISFSRGAELTRIFGNKIRLAESQNERNQIIEKYLIALRQSKLPNRTKHRTEPRKVVRNKKRYPLMSKSRKLEREIILSSGTTKT